LQGYRQSEIYAREGVDLDRSTLAGWVGATSELLAPLVEPVRDHVVSASKLHADDTPAIEKLRWYALRWKIESFHQNRGSKRRK
jgi:hypothetical protein